MNRPTKTIGLTGLAIIIALTLGLSACGSRSQSPSNQSPWKVGSQGAEGFMSCYECHADSSNPEGLDVVFGDSDAAMANAMGWLSGPHANQESLDGTGSRVDQGPDNTGYPSYADFTDATCATCHDDLGDGRTIAAAGVEAIGLVDRPVSGCESCHGYGGAHYGVGDMQYVRPEAAQCGGCHNAADPHSADRPGGYAAYEYYAASGHAISNNSHVYDSTVTTAVKAKCAKCHTDEGAKLYVNNSPSELGSLAPMEGATPVQCRTCHDSHNSYKLLESSGTNALGNAASAEYMTCTNCHEDAQGSEYHGVTSSRAWDGGAVGVGNFIGSNRIISDTHFETAADSNIVGYIIKADSDNACEDCHNLHSADITINEQWAESAHGGHILSTIGNTGSMAGIANVTDAVAPAWGHYPWATDSSRAACRRCHTSTGFKAFISDPALYNAAALDFSPLITNSMSEMLYCWACHATSPPNATLRDTHTMAETIEYTTPAGRVPGDLAGSNMCISCHIGRVSGNNIHVGIINVNTNSRGTSSHYLAAGGILYRTIGYEYTGMTYDNPAGFMHDQVGMTMPNTGANGPCVGCHMRGNAGHTMEPVTKDAGGSVIALPSYSSTCAACHSNEATLISTINTKEAGYAAAMASLKGLLDVRPEFDTCASFPYIVREGLSCEARNAYPASGGSWDNEGVLGAAFNYTMLVHEPGAFAHNSTYAKRLVYDSIDWMDDNTLDRSVANTIGAGPALTWLGGGARP